jgi:hypothetical protein
MKTGIELIAIERARQVEKEGWTKEHDATHVHNEMAKAAACYAMPISEREKYQSYSLGEPRIWFPRWWPREWDVRIWWKPTPNDRIKELVKAGALIAAEIDRLQTSPSNP